jgi:Helix-turn-helix domain
MQATGPKNELPPLLTVQEVAAALRLDPSAVYRAAQRGDINSVRPNARADYSVRIPLAELRRLQVRSAQIGSDRQEFGERFLRRPG